MSKRKSRGNKNVDELYSGLQPVGKYKYICIILYNDKRVSTVLRADNIKLLRAVSSYKSFIYPYLLEG